MIASVYHVHGIDFVAAGIPDVAGVGRGEVDERGRDFDGLACPTHGDRDAKLLDRLIAHSRRTTHATQRNVSAHSHYSPRMHYAARK